MAIVPVNPKKIKLWEKEVILQKEVMKKPLIALRR